MTTLQRQAAQGLDLPQCLRTLLLNRARGLDFYGKVSSFFLLSAVMTVYSGIRNAISYNFGEEPRLDLFSYILPFIGFVSDAAIKRVFLLSAKNGYVVIKIALLIGYLVLFVLSIQNSGFETY
jgi:hypothetical protein